MFARVQTFHQPAETLDQLAEVARQQLSSAHEFTGFKGFYYLVDRDSEKALVISLWEREEDLRQVEPSGAASVRDDVRADVGVTAPPAEIFQVSVSGS